MRFPIIKVKDNYSGREHIVGTDTHDMLNIEDGSITYYNLQNGDGTPEGYSFSGREDDEWFGVTVEMVTFDELKEIFEQENKRDEESRQKREELMKFMAANLDTLIEKGERR